MPKKTAKRKAKKTAKKSAKKKVIRKKTKTRKVVKKTARKSSAVKKKARKKKPAARPKARAKSVSTSRVKPAAAPIAEQRVGVVTHYYNHLSVAVVKLDQGALQVGDVIHVKGHTTDIQQRIDSMQVEHESIERAEAGQEFGMKVAAPVREHDVVYRNVG